MTLFTKTLSGVLITLLLIPVLEKQGKDMALVLSAAACCMAALAVFTFTLYDSPAVNIMDFIFHIWVIASLFHGAAASKKLKKLPAEETAKIQNVMDGIPVLGEDSEDLF